MDGIVVRQPLDLIQAFSRTDFLLEIHHLLWVEPQMNKGTWDIGWNCRDHAFVVAAVAQMLGFKSSLAFGKAVYVQGPSGELPPVGCDVFIHSWTMVEGAGFYDLSIGLDRVKEPGWQQWDVKALCGRGFHPVGRATFAITDNALEHKNQVATATKTVDLKAGFYLGQTYENLSGELLSKSTQVCNSLLTDLLRTQFGEKTDFHCRAALHLIEFLRGEAQSLTAMSQMDAWATLCRRLGNTFYRVCSRGRLS